MTGRKWNLPRKWWYSTVRQIGFRLLMTSLVFSNFIYTLSYDITNLYTENLSLFRFFILCILYLLFTWFHVSNDKETLRSFFFFSHRQAFYRTSLYIRIPPPPPHTPPPPPTPLIFGVVHVTHPFIFLCFLSSFCVLYVQCCQCLCIINSWLPFLWLSLFFFFAMSFSAILSGLYMFFSKRS